MPPAPLARLAQQPSLRILLVNAGASDSLTWAGVVHPWRVAERQLPEERLELVACDAAQALAYQDLDWDLVLLCADEVEAATPPAALRALLAACARARLSATVGAAVLWQARSGQLNGVRAALPWSLYADLDGEADQAIITPAIFELDGPRLTCAGGAVSADFALTLIERLLGTDLMAVVKETLCIERVRTHDERQRIALQARFGPLQPKLSEAVTLMENNLEEPLATDDIANLVGLSRRQLERLFKQHLGSLPSRYYLELRLKRARQLLRETNHSIVQVGLMCGFSSGSHFSTAFGALFGNTPREERQRKLSGTSN